MCRIRAHPRPALVNVQQRRSQPRARLSGGETPSTSPRGALPNPTQTGPRHIRRVYRCAPPQPPSGRVRHTPFEATQCSPLQEGPPALPPEGVCVCVCMDVLRLRPNTRRMCAGAAQRRRRAASFTRAALSTPEPTAAPPPAEAQLNDTTVSTSSSNRPGWPSAADPHELATLIALLPESLQTPLRAHPECPEVRQAQL